MSLNVNIPRMIEINCLNCNKIFNTYPSLVLKYSRKFCSRACAWSYNSKKYSGNAHPNFKEKIDVKCSICDKPKKISPYMVNSFRYCSRKCKHIGQSKSMQGDKNYFWLGGVGEGTQRWGIGFTGNLKHRVRDRDNFECQICHLSQKDSDLKFVVHHRDLNPKNNSMDNLQFLCNSCHITLHDKLR